MHRSVSQGIAGSSIALQPLRDLSLCMSPAFLPIFLPNSGIKSSISPKYHIISWMVFVLSWLLPMLKLWVFDFVKIKATMSSLIVDDCNPFMDIMEVGRSRLSSHGTPYSRLLCTPQCIMQRWHLDGTARMRQILDLGQCFSKTCLFVLSPILGCSYNK